MPVSFSSPARNLFLLGSSGRQVVSNFFESISKASTTDGVFIPDEIRYIADNKKYALSGSAADSNSKGFGWLERQDYDLETGSLTTDYSNRIESTLPNLNTTLRAMELDSNNNLIVVGFSGTSPWIAKYSNDGVLDWQSTSNSANVRYLGVTSDSSGNYYACGRTSYALSDTQAFVEKFDSNGNPGWGKQAFMLGRDVVLAKISANDRGEVVAVGFLEDDSANKGYIVKIDTNTGEILWDRTLERNISGYGGFVLPSSGDDITPADVKCLACYIDSKDQIYVVGSIDGKGTNDNGVGEFLIKYSPEGNIIWQRERDTRDFINNPSGAPNTVPFDVKSDGETEQTVVLSVDSFGTAASIELSKYSKSGDLVFRRRISKSAEQLGAASLDADPSFYYFIFRDQEVDGLAGEPDRYTFGKVSTSGNGLGAFQYDDGTPTVVDYTISNDTENKIGRMSDGSVTNSVSDLMTYPFTANQVVFDDLATHVSNKKRQMDDADSFEYSGSPAIRVADFMEMDLGDESIDVNVPAAEELYDAPGTYTFIVPAGVTEVSAIVIGGGGGAASSPGTSNSSGGGGGGGGTAWGTFTVTPGETLDVIVGSNGVGGSSGTAAGTAGGDSTIARGGTVLLSGGGGTGGLADAAPGATTGVSAAGGTSTGTERDGGGSGGSGGPARQNNGGGGGGGAGGYNGNGGDGGTGNAGTGGFGAGGAGGGGAGQSTGGTQNNGGGGLGIFGGPINGAGSNTNSYGGGGSNGQDGQLGGIGGKFGGGGGGAEDDTNLPGGNGGIGGARIIWGTGRSFPNNAAQDFSTVETRVVDRSGNGNDGLATFVTTTPLPGTTESENFRTVTSSYSTYGTVAENTVTNDLPYNNADWAHYGGKVRDLQTGGFRIDLTGNSNGSDFFMACWVKFDTYGISRQMGIDLFGDYVYWETLANGAIAVRHNGGNRADSSATSLNDGNWHHIALSRTGGTLYGMLDGTSVISTTSGVSGASVNANENFWFFGGSGNAYITDAKILDPIICIGTGTSSYTVPTEPVIDANGTFPNAAPHVPFFSNNWAYISPAIALGGSATSTTSGPTLNAAGYWEFDGSDYIETGITSEELLGGEFAVELWFNVNDTPNSINKLIESNRSSSSINWALYVSGAGGGGGQGDLRKLGTGGDQTSNYGGVDDGSWHHVVMNHRVQQELGQFSLSSFDIYLDGENVSSNELDDYDTSAAYGFIRVGTDFDGNIGEVRIYRRELTAAQVFQNYNATKSKFINEAPDTAPKIGPGIVYGSNLLLNYDFGNRATYDDTQNYLLDDFASDNDTGSLYDGTHKIYQADTDINSAYGGSQFFSSGTYDVSVSMWMKADDLQTNQFALKNSLGAPVTSTYNFTPGVSYPDGGIISHTWSNVTISDSWNFGVYNNNGDARTMLYARPQLTLKSSTGRYVKTYGIVITAPDTVKNLSSSSYTGTLNGGASIIAGSLDLDGSATQELEFGSTDWGGVLSIEMWIKTRETAQEIIADLVATATNHIGSDVGFRITRGGNLSNELRFGFRGNVNYQSGFTFTNNQWEHYVITFNDADPESGSNFTSYKNGSSGTITDAGTTVLAGQQTTNKLLRHDMQIAEFRIYDKVLSASEVSQNFNATRGKYGV